MQKINESGRSMVEMLGVLAIIGLLSVGGIAGYIQAMKSHRANETIQHLMRRAVVISGQRQLGQNASLAGFNENDGTYTMTLNEGASGNATTFTMGVSGVPEEVCTRIKNMDWKIATVSDDCATFTFNNDLTERTGDSGAGEGSGSGEGSGDGAGTPEETKTPQQLCEEDSSKVWCDNACYNAVFYISSIDDETRMYSDNGVCACDENVEAVLWNHRCIYGGNQNICETVLEDCPFPTDSGVGCMLEIADDSEYWFDEYEELGDKEAKKQVLLSCGFQETGVGNEYELIYCPNSMVYNGFDNDCMTCDDLLGGPSSEYACELCGGEHYSKASTCCEKGTCFSGNGSADGTGTCHDPQCVHRCDSPEIHYPVSQSECARCKQRVWTADNGGTCALRQ